MEAVFILMVIFGGVIGIIAVPKWVRAKYDPKLQALKALEDRRMRELEARTTEERRLLEERIEHLETIVTSVDMEFNTRLNRLLAAEEARQIEAPQAPLALLPAAAPAGQVAHAPTQQSGVPARAGTEPGSVFAGRFEIRSLLGRGGMGVVYKAHDRQLGEEVAIKVTGAELAGDPVTVDRLRREAAAARRITHENVIRVFDLGEAGGRFFISMEYFAGERLSDLVARDGPLAIPKVKAVCAQMASALSAAHAAGVVHRDLKPQNVMMDTTGRLKVIDFGIALAPHLRGLTATGLIMGTPEYMAPEQIRGEEVDARTDLYAFGCVVYFLLTGRPPFLADTPIAIGFAHLRKEPSPPSHLREDLGRGWDDVCLRALAKERTARFQNAAEMGDAIRKV